MVTNNQPSDMLWKIKKLEYMVHDIPCSRYKFKENKLVLTFDIKKKWWHHCNNFVSNAFEYDASFSSLHHTDCLVS